MNQNKQQTGDNMMSFIDAQLAYDNRLPADDDRGDEMFTLYRHDIERDFASQDICDFNPEMFTCSDQDHDDLYEIDMASCKYAFELLESLCDEKMFFDEFDSFADDWIDKMLSEGY